MARTPHPTLDVPLRTLLVLLPLTLACTTDEKTCATGGVGTLDLQITLPADGPAATPGRALVYNEAGELVATADGSTTLTDLPSGLYTVATERQVNAAVGSGLSGTAWGVLQDTVQQICVAPDETTVLAIEYVDQPSGGHLWVSGGERLAGFSMASLGASGDASADLLLDITPTNDLRGFAFDPLGNLWVATSPTYDTRLLVFAPGAVDTSGTVEPDATVAPAAFGSLPQIAEIAFDKEGNLWMLSRGGNDAFVGLYVYTAAQQRAVLLGEDAGDPAYTLTVDGLVTPSDMLFGPGGDLWIADFDGGAVLRIGVESISLEALTARAALLPTAAIVGLFDDNGASGDLVGPNDLTLTSDGTLWVTYWTSARLAGFATAVGLDGSYLPDFTADTGTMALPSGLATDATDGVWYGNEPQDGAGELIRVNAAGDTPVVVRTEDQPTPVDMSFDPAP